MATNAPAATAGTAVTSQYDIGNYETANFSKWSEGGRSGGGEDVVDHCPLTMNENEKKIRKNLFGNSYFYNNLQQSSQSRATATNSINCGLGTMTATPPKNGKFP